MMNKNPNFLKKNHINTHMSSKRTEYKYIEAKKQTKNCNCTWLK